MSSYWKYAGAAAAVAILVAGGFYWRSGGEITLAVAPVEKNVAVRVFGIGTIEAQVVSRVGFQIAGMIVQITGDQGDLVQSGALLAKLDDSAQRAKLLKSEAAVRQAAANLTRTQALRDRAKVNYQQKKSASARRQSLIARGAVSQEAAEDAQAAEEIAQSELAVAEADAAVAAVLQDDAAAQREIDKVVVNQHELRAPFEARVIARHKELGSVANPGEAIFTLIVPGSIWVRAYVDESLAGGLAPGQTAFVRLRSEFQTLVEAEIIRIDQESDRVTEERLVYVRCRACDPAHQLRYLGEQAEIEIVKKILPSGRFVPMRMVEGYDGHSGAVWVIDEGRLARRRLPLGERLLDGRIQIGDDVPAATQIVIEDRADLREGRAARARAAAP